MPQKMRAPNGEEAIVPDEDVEHYVKTIGAQIVFPGAEAQFAPEEPGLEAPPFYADPVDIPGILLGGAARRAVSPVLAAGGRLVGRGVAGAGGLLSRIAGAPGVNRLPASNLLRDVGGAVETAALKGVGRSAAMSAAEQAARAGARAPGAAMASRAGGVELGRMLPEEALAAPTGAGRAAEETALTGMDKLRQMKPLRANASAGAKQQHLLEMEQAMAEAKLPEPAKKRLLAQMGHGPQKPFRPGKTKLEVVEGGKGKAPLEGMAERAKAKAPERPRHDVRYYSKSRGEHIDIEGMNQKHLEQAFNQLAKTNPKPGSVARKQMDALLEEAKHRYRTTDIHIGQGGQK